MTAVFLVIGGVRLLRSVRAAAIRKRCGAILIIGLFGVMYLLGFSLTTCR